MTWLPILLSFMIFNHTASAEMWDGYNNPANMDVHDNYEYNINKLPAKAMLDIAPWSETYWPAYKGSINIRWNTVDKDGFYYTLNSREEVMAMSQAELKTLSPSEKYDIFMGRYDYPTYYTATGYSNPKAEDWQGICDGWVIAAIQYAEPAPVTLANPDGVMVPFGSSDIKGLMTFAAVNNFDLDTRQVGSKCDARTGGCGNDINAGSLHVILANQIGIKKQSFVTERDPNREIWNQPTLGYEFEFLGSAQPSSDADHAVYVHGLLHYTDELDDSSWEPVMGTDKAQFAKLTMDYVLELDAEDNIVGGYWLRGSDHPDFVWLPVNKLTFTGPMEGINRLYKPARTLTNLR